MIETIRAHDHEYRIENPGGLIGKAIAAGNPYEAPVLEYIHSLGLEGTAVDAGASIGNHTLWLSAICGLKVYAFEPLDAQRLLANVALNPDLPITVYPVGLGYDHGRSEVTGPPLHVVGSDLASPEVEIHPLDSYGLEDVSLIKIDVEGMEPDVISGAVDTIQRCRPRIFAEAASRKARYRNAEVLDALGYELEDVFGATPLQEWTPC
jgi:FkbM family methyltransferase